MSLKSKGWDAICSLAVLTGTSIVGLLGGIGHLALAEFKCMFKNIKTTTTFNARNFNLTALIETIRIKGDIELPVETNVSVKLSTCKPPLIVGLATGFAVGAVGLTLYYGFRQRNQIHNRRHLNTQEEELSPTGGDYYRRLNPNGH